ncbi:VPLPA-CTERM sorting domain-containing protein [Yoonia sp. F2084L]|uniref:VPLPA-CTERM sorting domain-containing protein n=1 Tax=Yoonia sp. F2084L TaxID=2926419 RepID=UPI001FF37EB0|nr:VPLPA-CTERM sorting domain-containing protein [Yoonia sp. F2084L]MCK0093971.1 VPLPA-CTERM sorting domain-containing protein [Yoonia sp. F2084L]
MTKNFLLIAASAMMLSATAASAATLNFVGTDQTHLVTRNDVNAGFNTTIDIITGDQKSIGNGLFLDLTGGSANVTYTFIGAEAGNRNYAASAGSRDFFNRGHNASDVGDQVTVIQDTSGLLDFAFGTYAPLRAIGEFLNNGLANPNSPHYAMGFIQIDADSFYVLFDDIATGDRDFDDMALRIDVAAIPLPAGLILLLSALGGAFMMRRKTDIA